MNAYKFRPSDQIDRIVDILINRRLYCAHWKDLNDPSEGHYMLSSAQGERVDRERAKLALAEAKAPIRVCSLCRGFKNLCMWAHYANGFDGVAIEVEIGENLEPLPVEYVARLPRAKPGHAAGRASAEKIARKILSVKLDAWRNEDEIRLLHKLEFLTGIPVKRLIIGPRVGKPVSRALQTICAHVSVRCEFAKVSKGAITAPGDGE